MTKAYEPKDIEQKWQKKWDIENLHKTDDSSSKPKFYCLEQFPYPSGHLHMGHMRVYSIGDAIARYMRMKGYEVLHAMGWDSFGMPAETAAIKNGSDPEVWTIQNIAHMKSQQKSLGLSIDWDREVTTCLPDYYKWTQQLFLLLFEKGLAYRKKAPVNWCPDCNTVLANEQVIGGLCWRCDSPVTKKNLEQWFFKITDYAERLLADLDQLENWSPKVKMMQKNWIGKSEGAEVRFPVVDSEELISVFTTRPDTVFGATFLALAPEHPLVFELCQNDEIKKNVELFTEKMKGMKEFERTASDVEKEGLFTGSYATNPLTNEQIPIWIANYILSDHGTGVIMGVPSHDERDGEFATKYSLPFREVISLDEKTQESVMIHSGSFTGMKTDVAYESILSFMEEKGIGQKTTSYRLRDWLVSRQRYWGAPIPIVYCESCGTVPLPSEQLPVALPKDVVFDGSRNPLTTSEEFVHTVCPSCGGHAKRETDTMDTFVDSSWYYLRYCDPSNQKALFDSEKANKWLQVDEYVGGIEHAILHLLYSRFITKTLFDMGKINVEEPFDSLLAQGMVLKDGKKMSKSKGNGVDPNEIISKYGADTARLYILSVAPPDVDFEWNDDGVKGTFKFLKRFWTMVQDNLDSFSSKTDNEHPASMSLKKKTHLTIKKVTHDCERRQFNTAISSIRELFNEIYLYPKEASRVVLSEAIRSSILLLAPFAPHITEELWGMAGFGGSVHEQNWISWNEDILSEGEREFIVQVNGKLKDKFSASVTSSSEDIESIAFSCSKVKEFLSDKTVKKTITLADKGVVNIII